MKLKCREESGKRSFEVKKLRTLKQSHFHWIFEKQNNFPYALKENRFQQTLVLPVSCLWKSRISNEVYGLCSIIKCCHIFMFYYFHDENDLSGAPLIEAIINSKLKLLCLVTYFSPGNIYKLLKISENHTAGISLKMCFKIGYLSSLEISTLSE